VTIGDFVDLVERGSGRRRRLASAPPHTASPPVAAAPYPIEWGHPGGGSRATPAFVPVHRVRV
jgi:hypothetical protein